jgi:hypothetical protein
MAKYKKLTELEKLNNYRERLISRIQTFYWLNESQQNTYHMGRYTTYLKKKRKILATVEDKIFSITGKMPDIIEP